MLVGMEKTMKSLFRYFLRETKGVAAIEVAFIMPFMLLLYFGLFDLTALITMNRKVTYAASVVADLVAQNKTSVLKSDITNYFKASEMVMSPMPVASVRVEVFGFRKTGTTIAQFWKSDNGQGSSCGAAPAVTAMDPLMVSGNDLVVSRVCTTYTPTVVSFLGSNILGSATFAVGESITERPRSTLALTCYQTTVAAGTVCS